MQVPVKRGTGKKDHQIFGSNYLVFFKISLPPLPKQNARYASDLYCCFIENN